MSGKIDKEIEELKERYKQLDDESLIRIVTVNRNDYTPRGIELARLELTNRNIKIDQQDQQEEQEEKEEYYSKTYSTENLWGKTYSNVGIFSKKWFIALWEGERPLWEAWIILGAALFIISNLIFPWLAAIYPNLIVLFYYILTFIQIFWWVAVWRCAPNTNYKIFFYIARFLVFGSIAQNINQWIS